MFLLGTLVLWGIGAYIFFATMFAVLAWKDINFTGPDSHWLVKVVWSVGAGLFWPWVFK